MQTILISFSGGRTSAFMTKFILEYSKFKDYNKVVCFANTGKEYEETLEFVNECDRRWNLGIVWLEAKVNNEKGKGTGFRIVDYQTASRDGEPFEEVIKKYGIPNKQFPHCTRELKQIPIRKYMQSLGCNEWYTAVGIRADEKHRKPAGNDSNFMNPITPLIDDIPVTEQFIRDWWQRQAFDLHLKDYQSNCDLCWKKSKRKRLTILSEEPDRAEWWDEMERKHGGNYRFDQREGLNITDLIAQSKKPFRKAIDKHELRQNQGNLFEPEMDIEYGCMCKET